MEALKGIKIVTDSNKKEQKVIVHELKYALLGAILMLIVQTAFTKSIINSIFPLSRGPLHHIYRIMIFVVIFYIVQKTDWFQDL